MCARTASHSDADRVFLSERSEGTREGFTEECVH